MEMILRNHRLEFVELFSVDSVSKQEREQGVIPPGVSMLFWAPPGTELGFKDFNTKTPLTPIDRIIVDLPVPQGSTRDARLEEQGNPEHYIDLSWREAVALSGFWTYRSFNPAYATGDQTPQQGLELILADGFVFNFQTPTSTTLEGTFGSPDGGFPLDLKGTVQPGVGGAPVSFEIVGTGRTGTETDGWEYRYQGHLTRNWPTGADQRPTLVGSVIRAKAHDDRRAGDVYSFIAVKRQPVGSEVSGLWDYRSFHDNPAHVYRGAPRTQPKAHELILQEAGFLLETPTSTTLQGAMQWMVPRSNVVDENVALDLKGTVRPGAEGEPSSFEIAGTGRPGTDTAGWEYYYQGHLTRQWPNGFGQRPALVGSVFRAKPHGDAPAGYVAPFIAVKSNGMLE
jgi:hypothetical protein